MTPPSRQILAPRRRAPGGPPRIWRPHLRRIAAPGPRRPARPAYTTGSKRANGRALLGPALGPPLARASRSASSGAAGGVVILRRPGAGPEDVRGPACDSRAHPLGRPPNPLLYFSAQPLAPHPVVREKARSASCQICWPGWTSTVTTIRPRRLVDRIAANLHVPATAISPATLRNDVLIRREPFRWLAGDTNSRCPCTTWWPPCAWPTTTIRFSTPGPMLNWLNRMGQPLFGRQTAGWLSDD